jgi:hypothetical protein
MAHLKETQSNLSFLWRKKMDSSGHYFSEYSDSKKSKDWRKQYSDGSNRVLQLRFHQVIRCGSYGFALNYKYLPSFYVALFCENWIIEGRKLNFNPKPNPLKFNPQTPNYIKKAEQNSFH